VVRRLAVDVIDVMEAPTLSYLFSHPTHVGVAFERPLALLLLAAAPVFLLLRSRLGRRAAHLRSGAYAALVLATAGVALTVSLPDQPLSLVVAVDTSESIDAKGSEWALRYVRNAASGLAPGDEIAVLTFAKDVRLIHPPGPAPAALDFSTSTARTATNLDLALDTAAALFPGERTRRLLLVSDGNETRGDSRRQIPRLREAAVRVDVAVPPGGHAPDVQLDKLILAPQVPEEHVVPLRIVARNTGKLRPAVLTLYLDDRVMDSAAIELQPGLNSFELPAEISGRGSHRLKAALAVPDDPTPSDNYREVGVTVRGRIRILLIDPHERSPLAGALQRRGIAVDLRTPERLTTLDDLPSYDAVILEDVGAADLSAPALARIEGFVRDFGGGLVVAGGETTFGDPAFAGTALEPLLPVTLEPRRPKPATREPLALFIVIDRSNSMGYNSRIGTLRDGEKLRYAKEAALAVVRQLRDEDLVGVIAFDSQPRELAPLRPLRENRERLQRLIPRLVENGGTDFFDALESARAQLAASRVDRRHVVLLTDGDTNRSAMDEYRDLIGDLAAAEISVTTIRIGDNTVNLRLLQDISDQTGGRFYYVEDAQTLPDLMLQDTTRALGPLNAGTERYFPQTGSRSQALSGIDEHTIPTLSGYAYSRPRDGAEIALHVTRLQRRDPILAVWRYGLGHVAAFTASPSLDAEQWWGWTQFAKFWSQLVHWTASEHAEGSYVVDAVRMQGATELTVRTSSAADEDATLFARLHLDDGVVREIGLVSERPRSFTAHVPSLPGGRYPLTILRRSKSGAVSEQTFPVTIPDEEVEPRHELERRAPDLGLLTALAEGTGGKLNPNAREVVEREVGSRRAVHPLDALLLPLAMFLFLADVAVRRLGYEVGAAA
jgi:Mg-chelatase subunit ChlD